MFGYGPVCVHRVSARELVKKRVNAGNLCSHLVSLFRSLMSYVLWVEANAICLSGWIQTGALVPLAMLKLKEQSGIEVLGGRELGPCDVLSHTHYPL